MSILLFGGLTSSHDALYQGAFESLGYRARALPQPDNRALKTGRIYCNKGQCNPIYYTAGNLINFLNDLRDRGETDLSSRYFFVTAGSCGPCRFGMYELEYRKALRDAGYPDFKVIAIQQSNIVMRDLEDFGITVRKRDFFQLLKPLILGDLINDLYYKTRPYETEPGAADRWREQTVDSLRKALAKGGRVRGPVRKALKKSREALSRVDVDLLQPRPRVKIIGEFFSHIQEGDPSYHMPEWLLEEGAEPSIEPITTWIDYLLWAGRRQAWMRTWSRPFTSLRQIAALTTLKWIIHLHFFAFRLMLRRKPDPLVRQSRIAADARPYYHPELAGGEGHMEVGKHIHIWKHHGAHLILSIKPFGCMPSTQSDGVQMKVTDDLGSSFLSIDTSGDAEVNARSRVAMKLQEAQGRTEQDFSNLCGELGMDCGEQLSGPGGGGGAGAALTGAALPRSKSLSGWKPKKGALQRLPRGFRSTAEAALRLLHEQTVRR